MAYQYDVFISYRSTSRQWLRELFLPTFRHFLEEEVGKDVRIFVDWHDIQTGNAWNERLRNGLLYSKCLVSLLLPTYFESNWCKKEFAVFEHRSRQNGMLSLAIPEGLIIPVVLHSGREFPDVVRSIQYRDYGKFYVPNIEGFKNLKKYPQLQEEIKDLVRVVAQTLQNTPQWHPDWQQDNWLEVSTDHLAIPVFTVQQPKI